MSSESNLLAGGKEAIGQSEAFLTFQEALSRVAPIHRPVLIFGERGTGKELAAARLHFLSKRWQGPLVALNCSALAPTLIEAELFGYEKGAFTGAVQRRTGRFEKAHHGTLFLDEIGTIPMEVQEKILRVVEYGTFEPVGSSDSIEVDVRIVAASNVDLQRQVQRGKFKPDLLDRLSFEVIYLPPLRDRKEDIMLLAGHFAARMAFELGKNVPEFNARAILQLERYHWPGNIRELKNVVERAVYRADSDRILEISFDPFESPYRIAGEDTPLPYAVSEPRGTTEDRLLQQLFQKPFDEALREFKFVLIENALQKTHYNQKQAAEMLGMTYHQFRGVYRKYKNLR